MTPIDFLDLTRITTPWALLGDETKRRMKRHKGDFEYFSSSSNWTKVIGCLLGMVVLFTVLFLFLINLLSSGETSITGPVVTGTNPVKSALTTVEAKAVSLLLVKKFSMVLPPTGWRTCK